MSKTHDAMKSCEEKFASIIGNTSRAKRAQSFAQICHGRFMGGKTVRRDINARGKAGVTCLSGNMFERQSVRYDGRLKACF
mmetsp:Transcript_7568/g.33737  ORF Transcript_7568/g.33737 Transcript_7568/m.33737 type:complete len:81 (-) Transcript_7568:2031-2273(-)